MGLTLFFNLIISYYFFNKLDKMEVIIGNKSIDQSRNKQMEDMPPHMTFMPHHIDFV